MTRPASTARAYVFRPGTVVACVTVRAQGYALEDCTARPAPYHGQ
jgi:hypothetical protein